MAADDIDVENCATERRDGGYVQGFIELGYRTDDFMTKSCNGVLYVHPDQRLILDHEHTQSG
ncbi:hypothetical protein [Caulobacter sp. DWR3-1-2]|uniref:hypothetical protein n=1 Tax=Caulobacter sp. DWR3-1-2 TaxID=2804647 RepID=UPI003CFAC378